MKSTKGVLIASAVASLFIMNAANAQEKQSKDTAKGVKCAGINECKGKGACSGADNACKGKNDCKGKGWVEAKTEKDCTGKGGKVVTAAK